MRRITFLVVLVAFTFSCGGQWAALQCVAWANMIREYSEMVPMTQAVKMTFSGQYPCTLCKTIAEKKQSENAKVGILFQHEKKVTSSGFLLVARSITVSIQDFAAWSQFLRTRSDAPPVPPPRFA